jgi:hypothetical protein
MYIGDRVKVKIGKFWHTGIYMGQSHKMSMNLVRVCLDDLKEEQLFNLYEVTPFEESPPPLCKIIVSCTNKFHIRRVAVLPICKNCVVENIC